MSQTIAAERHWPVSPAGGTMRAFSEGAAPQARTSPLQKSVGRLGDAALLLVAVWLLPLVILLVGLPVVVLVRLVLEIAERM